jgi:hypothetical protein
MSKEEFKNPNSNWIVRCLLRGDLSIRTDGKIFPIEVDEFTLDSLKRVIEGIRKPGSITILGPDCRIPLLPIAGAAIAYHMDDMGISEDHIIYAFSKDKNSRLLLNDLGYQDLQNGPVVKYYPVATISHHFRNISKAIKRKEFKRPPRIIFSDTLSPDVLTKIVDAEFKPRVVLLDGRTLWPTQMERVSELRKLLPESSFILISPSIYLDVSGFPAPDIESIPMGTPLKELNGKPLLVNSPPKGIRLHARPLECDVDPCCDTLKKLNLSDHSLMDEFSRQSWSLFRTLLAIPVSPEELNLAWSMKYQMLEHPINSSIGRLKAIHERSLQEDDGISVYLNTVIHELEQLTGKLDVESPKKGSLIELVSNGDNYTIIVDKPVTAKSTSRALHPINNGIQVRSWYDPPTWAPVNSKVILTCPPPFGREWMTNVNMGEDITFLFYPIEAALMAHRYRKIGLNKGVAWEKLVSMTINAESVEIHEGQPRYAEDIEFMLDGLSESSTIVSRMKFRSGQGETEEKASVIPVHLNGGGVFWARRNADIAVYRDGNIRYRRPTDLEENDIIAVPSNSPDSYILEAFFDAVETKPGNEHIVGIVRQWKSEMIRKKEEYESDFGAVAGSLGVFGANVTTTQVRNMLTFEGGRERQISIHEQEKLIRASFKFLGKEYKESDVNELSEAIRRLRGLHQNAGKLLKKMARSAFITFDDHLDSKVENEFGLTLADLRDQVDIFVVDSISSEEIVPASMAGNLEIPEEEMIA